MPIKYLSKNIILEKTEQLFENQAVLNPAAFQEGDITHLWYRAVRKGNYSSIGYARLRDNKVIYRSTEPILSPHFAYEQHGLEDPRVVRLDDTFYMFYTVYDGTDIQVAYATAKDPTSFKKQKIISPQISFHELHRRCSILKPTAPLAFFRSAYLPEDSPKDQTLLMEKDVFAFPRRINGRLALMHRIKPDIQLVYCNDFKELTKPYWLEQLASIEAMVVLEPKYWFESAYVGGGAPPIETNMGWLLIYHAVEDKDNNRIYRAGAALLNIDRPEIATHRLPYPLFEPVEEWEKLGDVNNVVFPTAALRHGQELQIYYGAADRRIAKISFNLNQILEELIKYPV